ncbi:MAG: hypothetical protein ACOY99_03460 [Pseudomonadota bacterium]
MPASQSTTADLVIGTARLPVTVIDLTPEGAAIDLPDRLDDFAGASLHVHGVGYLPLSDCRHLADCSYLLRFAVMRGKLRRKLATHIAARSDDLIGPAMTYLLAESQR